MWLNVVHFSPKNSSMQKIPINYPKQKQSSTLIAAFITHLHYHKAPWIKWNSRILFLFIIFTCILREASVERQQALKWAMAVAEHYKAAETSSQLEPCSSAALACSQRSPHRHQCTSPSSEPTSGASAKQAHTLLGSRNWANLLSAPRGWIRPMGQTLILRWGRREEHECITKNLRATGLDGCIFVVSTAPLSAAHHLGVLVQKPKC